MSPPGISVPLNPMEEEYYHLREYKKRMFRKKIRSAISCVLMLTYSYAWFYMLGSICP
ncbi:MAG: hypothetical protein QXZ28_00265 [Candidatus Methanomethylicaceae archaeon]